MCRRLTLRASFCHSSRSHSCGQTSLACIALDSPISRPSLKSRTQAICCLLYFGFFLSYPLFHFFSIHVGQTQIDLLVGHSDRPHVIVDIGVEFKVVHKGPAGFPVSGEGFRWFSRPSAWEPCMIV